MNTRISEYMARVSKLAKKKINELLFCTKNTKYEHLVLNEIIYSGLPTDGQYVKCNKDELRQVISKLQKYSIEVIGVESSFKDTLNQFTLIIEDLPKRYETKPYQWILNVIMNKYIDSSDYIWLRFYIQM